MTWRIRTYLKMNKNYTLFHVACHQIGSLQICHQYKPNVFEGTTEYFKSDN